MSEELEPSVPKAPHRNRQWLIPTSGLAIALALAGLGVANRVGAEAAMKAEARDSAIPIVSVSRPEVGPPFDEVVLPGQVKGLNETPIYARASGYVKRWSADIGARVKTGQLLAEIDAPEIDQQLRQAEADLKAAQANATVAKSTADRVQGLVTTQSVSRQEGEDRVAAATALASLVASNQANVEKLRRVSGFKRITAPYDGVITARETEIGNLVNAGSGTGQELFRIADISRLRIYVQVPQTYAGRIRAGGTAELHFPEYPAKAYAAVIVRTAHALDPQSRTLLVELQVDNTAEGLFPGSFTQVRFKLPTAAGRAAVLAANTLLFRAEGLRVAVLGDDNRVTLKAITLGRDFGTSVEVATGIDPTDRVILNPPAAIQTGDTVRLTKALSSRGPRS
jgi:RND family efflux transporter MFP subunit